MKLATFAQAFAGTALLAFAACSRPVATSFQGYLEGEFVYVAAPLAGRLEHLAVAKGSSVGGDAPLFTLEHAAETAVAEQAAALVSTARARLADLRKGARPSELDALAARLAAARSAAELSRLDAERQSSLFRDRVVPVSDYDRSRLAHERDLRAVDDLEAQLATARLGARPDAVAAAEQEVAAALAAQAQAAWAVAQKTVSAPAAALVHDTLYRPGEFVAAGRPVVSLLPPGNIKVRFFAPEPALAALRPGARVRVALDGRASLQAVISYVSPQAEYTPPVLYNRENRAKLVYLAEAVFAPEDARGLHPGQPADVSLLP